ncbi:MAG: hypothetical protein A2521_02650 [Deltaproteobacteria bacterium RIFOXYD12_FULL_57_12]|nr:MAG: hypothetical protein A2521_02650 [Deltaproteobacteria bacterium RIFOXYD12_FULL_57_12]
MQTARSLLPSVAGPGSVTACRFVLTAEISSIYKRHGRVRKIHNLLFVPDLEAAARLNARLAAIGNIESDGRPILGLDARNLLEILLEQAPEGFLVPAHIWTPWFSLFGSKSGFDSIEECFDDLSSHVFALETGLSSDPDMNRRVSALDRFALISNSDCHSPGKLGREANIFDTDFNFFAMRDSLKAPGRGFLGTLEFFPEEGKYHYDGHRKCQICLDPLATRQQHGICPVCQRPLTIGVMYRVLELADRQAPFYPDGAPGFNSMIPLSEILGEILGQGSATKGVMEQYWRMITRFGSEFALMLHTPIEEIRARSSPVLAEAVDRIRKGRVIRKSGYDGEFGVITVFEAGELAEVRGQHGLFAEQAVRGRKQKADRQALPIFSRPAEPVVVEPATTESGLNPEQTVAVTCDEPMILVQAGPGTGKTHTLIARLARLLAEGGIAPTRVAAITFTNRAATELADRLARQVGAMAEPVFVGTFHAFCLHWLRQQRPGLVVVGEENRRLLLRTLFSEADRHGFAALQKEIVDYFLERAVGATEPAPTAAVRCYLEGLTGRNAIDLQAVIPFFVREFKGDAEFRRQVTGQVSHLFVDEFQDLNSSQYELVRLLAANAKIFAIGDPDQAIYGFRGSSPRFFYDFQEEFRARRITLTRNYRSGVAILAAASAVIDHNPTPDHQPRLPLVPRQDLVGGGEYYWAASVQAEAEFVVRRIEELVGGISHFSINTGRGGDQPGRSGFSFRDIAVLYRSSRQAQALCEALTRRGIPLQVVGVPPFYMQDEVKPLYFWLRAAAASELAMTAADYLDFLRDLSGIGATSLQRLEASLPLGDIPDFFQQAGRIELSAAARKILLDVEAELDEARQQMAQHGVVPFLSRLLAGLDINPALPEVARFLDLVGSFGRDLGALARYLQRNAGGTVYDDQAETVALMTLHAAKGLEFPAVFITGLEEGVLPWRVPGRGAAGEGDIEEERRLFYVGLTRAREFVALTGAATRPIFAQRSQQQPSRFLAEIPAALFTRVSPDGPRRKNPAAVQLKLF